MAIRCKIYTAKVPTGSGNGFFLFTFTLPCTLERRKLDARSLHSSLPCVFIYRCALQPVCTWSDFETVMSGSTPPPPLAETMGTDGCFPPGYKHFKPEEHGLERGFRLTAFSDLKGWGCKVPQEALLKLLAGLEADRVDRTGKAGDDGSDFSQQLAGPRLGKKLTG